MNKLAKLSAVGLVGLCATAHAETLAWYHFDEAANGTRTDSTSVFLNAIDPAKGKGCFRNWKKSSSYSHDATISTDPCDYYPEYVAGFPESVRVLDPVSSEVTKKISALHLTCEDKTQSDHSSGAIAIAEDIAETHLQTFTIELFVRLDPESVGGGYRYFLQKVRTDGEGAIQQVFAIRTGWDDGKPVFETSCGSASSSVAINDGKWHHLAAVVREDWKLCYIYVDGVEKAAGHTGNDGLIDYSGAGPLCIGTAYKSYFGVWEGDVDEIRISEGVLPSTAWLKPVERPTAVSPAATADSLVFVDFEGSTEPVAYEEFADGNQPIGTAEAICNKAPWNETFPNEPRIFTTSKSLTPNFVQSDDVPVAAVRSGLTGTNFASDVSSYSFSTNGVSGSRPTCLCVPDPNGTVFSDSATIEFSFKIMPGQIHSLGWATAYVSTRQGAYELTMMNDSGRIGLKLGGKNFVLIRGGGSAGTVTGESYNDGLWHSVAIVYDHADKSGLFYIDGELRGSETGLAIVPPDGTSEQGLFFMGAHYSDEHRICEGWLDNVRITRGALRPYQFLTTRAIEGANLGYAAFDGDYVISPYADLFKAATASGAAFSTERPASIILDGKDGEPIREKNTRSVALSGGSVTWQEHDIVTDSEKVTAEFFVKTQTPGAPLLAVGDIWSLDSSLTLAVGAESAAPESAAGLADGKWHHVAVVFDGAAAKVYVDYGVALEHVFASAPATAKAADLVLGGEGFTGNLDELRFTPSVLAADEFLTAFRKGLSVILR